MIRKTVFRRFIMPVLMLVTLGMTARAEEVFKIGTYRHYPPWTISEGNAPIKGFEPDIVADICRRMAARCIITAVDWENVFNDLEAGVYDAYIGGMSITAERAEKVSFTQPYADETASFATVSDNPLTSVLSLNAVDLDQLTDEMRATLKTLTEELRGKRLGVHVDTTNEKMIDGLMKGMADIHRYNEEQQMYDDLFLGKLDAMFADSSAIYYYVFSHKDQKNPPALFGPVLRGSQLGAGIGAAVKKNNETLLARLNAAIAESKADGTLSKLSLTWFGMNVAAAP